MPKLSLKCPKCRLSIKASDRFCGKCGRRIGFGVRSENEVRAALRQLDVTTFVVNDTGTRIAISSDINLINYVLLWLLGEKEDTPRDMLVKALQEQDKIRRKE